MDVLASSFDTRLETLLDSLVARMGPLAISFFLVTMAAVVGGALAG